MGYTRIKEILNHRGITSKELAAGVGMTESALSVLTSERGNPKLGTLQKIADYLGEELYELIAKPSKCEVTCPQCGATLEIEVRTKS